MERDALYFPYIHIRSVDWLKRALLVFPHVARIIPRGFTPYDDREIWEFENVTGRWGRPLLRSANLQSSGVQNAQSKLLKLLSQDARRDPDFLKKYQLGSDPTHQQNEFLLHRDKPLYQLVEFLQHNELMWRASFGSRSGDMAVHPIIGEMIMSTLAMACARDEGFDVVTDEGRIHYSTVETDVNRLYRQFMHKENAGYLRSKATDGRLCELLIFQQCDASKLNADALAELSKDHEAIGAFRGALARIAETIPEMQNEASFEDRLKAGVDDALRAWQQDKLNMSKISKEMFGREILRPTDGFVKGLAEKFGTAALGATVGGVSSGASGILLGAAGGFVVSLIFHGVSSWSRAAEKSANSPYRYLTRIEKAGVAFTMGR